MVISGIVRQPTSQHTAPRPKVRGTSDSASGRFLPVMSEILPMIVGLSASPSRWMHRIDTPKARAITAEGTELAMTVLIGALYIHRKNWARNSHSSTLLPFGDASAITAKPVASTIDSP